MVPGLAVRASPTTVILDAALVQSALLLSLVIQLCHGVSVTVSLRLARCMRARASPTLLVLHGCGADRRHRRRARRLCLRRVTLLRTAPPPPCRAAAAAAPT